MSKTQTKRKQRKNSRKTPPALRTSFAPAPWVIVEDRLVYSIGNNRFVADCKFGKLSPHDPQVDEQTANAQLIAAAPELYDAMKFVAQEIDGILHDETAKLDELTHDQLNEMLLVLWGGLAKARREAANV